MSYEELSDFEINKRVAFTISKTDFETNDCEVVRYFCDGQHLDEPEVFDPCNNPADAWPIITEMMNDSHVFTISDIAILWHGESDSDDVIIECEYPLRAFMICYLMMQEAK